MKITNKKLKKLFETFLIEASCAKKSNFPEQENLSQFIDHTLLKPETTLEQIKSLCDEAKRFGFKSVCIQPCFVRAAKKYLAGSKVFPITVVGFPLGANTTKTKVFETIDALKNGAKEIDMVINISSLKSGDGDAVFKDICAVVKVSKKIPVKVIVETAFLTFEEKVFLCACVQLSKAAYIKTSTGFAPRGADVEDIYLFKHLLKNNVKIKASGGIKTAELARSMISAGAERLGTSSGKDY